MRGTAAEVRHGARDFAEIFHFIAFFYKKFPEKENKKYIE